MKRHATTILAAVSLMLCIVALFAWVRSHLGESILLGSIPGALAFGSFDASQSFIENFWGASGDSGPLRALSTMGNPRRALGFLHNSGNWNGAAFWIIAIPYWLIVPLTAILPLRWWLHRRRRRAWAVSGRCLGCGYDLRGSPDRCPECGATNATRSTSASQPATP